MAKPTVGALGYRIKDLTGQTFGRLTVLAYAGVGKNGHAMWLCRCSCGGGSVPFGNNLGSGKCRSCGCLALEMATKHGETRRGIKKPPEYGVWANMIERCENPKNPRFKDWGGRGITICERWRSSYADFLADMGRRPSPKHSLDRVNNDGNYEPGNCRWATATEQNRNQRKRHVP